jgi:hypothetical protein
VFASQFREGHKANQNNTLRHRSIHVDEEFDILHTVLYYLYTSQITFDTHPDQNTGSTNGEAPKTLDVETIYTASKFYLLDDLTSKALAFIQSVCTVNNITARIFGGFAGLHPEVEEVYTKYFKEHVGEIMATSEYQEYFDALENEPVERRAIVNAKFRELVQDELRGTKRKR